MEKIDLRKASKEEKEAIRIRAIGMYNHKLKQNEIALLLGVHKNSVYQWVKLYKSQGKKGLLEAKRGRKEGEGKLLSLKQEKEIQKMIIHCEDITDKVIITGFSSGGFRLEAWDYFTWSDVVFFRNKDGSYKGGALRVYHGDVEEYWTHITPEFCNLLDLYKVYWKSKFFAEPLPSDPLLAQERLPYPARLKHGGVSRRVKKVVEHLGLRNKMIPGKQRYQVQLDHGFRKYFNTMLRRAKVDFADKEDMMGHKVGLESSYERYEEEEFERFPEYQKAIPFLTISDGERMRLENEKLIEEKSELETEKEKYAELLDDYSNFKDQTKSYFDELEQKINKKNE